MEYLLALKIQPVCVAIGTQMPTCFLSSSSTSFFLSLARSAQGFCFPGHTAVWCNKTQPEPPSNTLTKYHPRECSGTSTLTDWNSVPAKLTLYMTPAFFHNRLLTGKCSAQQCASFYFIFHIYQWFSSWYWNCWIRKCKVMLVLSLEVMNI